jgi:hypothetical protein
MKEIDPSQGVFKDGKELLSLTTQYVNMHDELITHVDASGKALAEKCLLRRIDCFDNFIGHIGRVVDSTSWW